MLRKLLIGLALALVIVGITRVRLDVDVLDLLPQEMKEVQGLRLFLEHFSRNEELILTLEHPDPELLATAQESLASHFHSQPPLGSCSSADLWTDASGEGLGEMVAWLLLNATPPERFAEIIQPLTPAQRAATLEDSLDTIGSSMEFDQALTLAYDPYQLVQAFRQDQTALINSGESFASDDGTFRVLYLQASEGSGDVITWVNTVKGTIRPWKKNFPAFRDIQVGFTGEPVFQAEISASMERDMKISGASALLLTAIIFGLAYRRARPLIALTAGLSLTFLLTLGLAGWALNSMTVMSVGFASILIGLTVDYGVIIYQSALHEVNTPAQLRQRTRKSILWAAGTTAAAFGALGLSVVPGIATLGQIVGIGILVGAGVMLLTFPYLMGSPSEASGEVSFNSPRQRQKWTMPAAVLILLLALTPFWLGLPPLDTSTEALRPRDSQAYETMDRVQSKLTGNVESSLAILTLSENSPSFFANWESRLHPHTKSVTLPQALVPHPSRQGGNLAQLTSAHLDLPGLQRAAEEAEFEPEAMTLTKAIVTHWQSWKTRSLPRAPESEEASRLWSRLIAFDEGQTLLMTTIQPVEGQETALWQLIDAQAESYPVSWPRITEQLNQHVPQDLRKVSLCLACVVIVMLFFTFRSWRAVTVSLTLTAITLLALCGAMRWLGWEWNFFSLGALLLTFGAGLDYSIHILLDHRRHPTDFTALHRGVLRALTVCALSTIAGFASIGWASNQGLASLGRVCALGLAINALVCLILLPAFLRAQQSSNRG